jgi:UDP-glucose 4-epimerase
MIKKTILITGSKGFIGSHIQKKLSKEYSIYNKNKIPLNLLDRDNILKMKKVDFVIHAAAKTPGKNNLHSDDFHKNNVLGTLNILDYCVKNNIKKLIYISSFVYGKPRYNPIDETHPINPHTDYSKSKFLAEEFCRIYSKLYKLNIVILRPFGIFGKSQKSGYIIPNLINSIKNKKEILIINKKSRRDFLFVNDFVDVISKTLKKNFKFEIFNIGSGISYSFEEIIQKIEAISSSKIKIKFVDDKNTYIPEIQADINKIKKALNWKPHTNIDDALNEMLNN